MPPVVILCLDKPLAIYLAIAEYISEAPFPSLWDILLADPSTMFWSCCVMNTCLDISY